MWLGILCLVAVIILKIFFDYRRPFKFPPGNFKFIRTIFFNIHPIVVSIILLIYIDVQGPRGFPILGNILDIAKLVKETKFYSNVWCLLAEKYGSVVGLRLGFDQPLIIVSGKAAITEMLNRPEFDGRPNGFLFKFRCGGTPQGLLFTDADVWNNQRRYIRNKLNIPVISQNLHTE